MRTGAFKKKVAKEERMVERGELARGVGGELPIESEERRKRKLLCMEDLRLALELGDGYLGQTPFVAGTIMNSRFLDTPDIESVMPNLATLHDYTHYRGKPNGDTLTAMTSASHKLNGELSLYSSKETWTVDINQGQLTGDPMQIDDDTANWIGGSVQDVEELDGALDDILSLGEM